MCAAVPFKEALARRRHLYCNGFSLHRSGRSVAEAMLAAHGLDPLRLLGDDWGFVDTDHPGFPVLITAYVIWL